MEGESAPCEGYTGCPRPLNNHSQLPPHPPLFPLYAHSPLEETGEHGGRAISLARFCRFLDL